MATIAFDSVLSMSDHTGSPASPVTDSFTNTAGNCVLIGVVARNGGDVVTGVTYNGVSCTQLGKIDEGTGAPSHTFVYLYGLNSPATGANTISVSFSGSPDGVRVTATSYTNVRTTGLPDASHTSASGGVSSVTDSVTVATPNSWTVIMVHNEFGNLSAGTGSTARGTAAPGQLFDSNGPLGTGSQSMQVTWGGNSFYGDVMVSIAPSGAISKSTGYFDV